MQAPARMHARRVGAPGDGPKTPGSLGAPAVMAYIGGMRHAVLVLLLLPVLAPTPASADVLADCTQDQDWWLRVRACTEAIEGGRWEGPAASWAYSNRAVARAALGDYIDAFDDHERAVALDPANASARNNKGNTHAEFREHARALAEFDRAIALDPGYASARYNRAGVRLTVGDVAGAIEDYSAVIAAEPGFGEAHAGRAEAACRAGDVAGSVADRLAAVRLGALAPEQVRDYLRQTGYLDAAAAASPAGLEAALTAWTAAGCP